MTVVTTTIQAAMGSGDTRNTLVATIMERKSLANLDGSYWVVPGTSDEVIEICEISTMQKSLI